MNKDILCLLKKIVAYDTTADKPDVLMACFAYLSDYFSAYNLKIEKETNESKPSIFATSTSSQPKVLLQAHLDVVPGKPEQYALKQENGKLYGRGVYDMKFAAACYMRLVENLKDELQDYDFGIMLTSDEEVGGENGVGYLLKRGYGADVCILPDGGDEWRLQASCNGLWLTRLKSYGVTAHGSRPWEGDCAVERLIEVLNEVKEIFGERDASHSSLTISQIQGGSAINQVAGYAEATLDMRFTNHEEYKSKCLQISGIINKAGLELETIAKVKPYLTDLDNPYIKKFVETASGVLGKPIGKTHSLGASDARHFAEYDIPVILIRPDGGGAHSDSEWIVEAGLETFYKVIKKYVQVAARVR